MQITSAGLLKKRALLDERISIHPEAIHFGRCVDRFEASTHLPPGLSWHHLEMLVCTGWMRIEMMFVHLVNGESMDLYV